LICYFHKNSKKLVRCCKNIKKAFELLKKVVFFCIKIKNRTDNMRFIKFLAAAVLTLILIFALSNSLTIKGLTLPAMGKLLNPFTGFWQNGEGGFDFFEQDKIKILSLKGKVKVTFDDRQVPHIFAENTSDLVKVQGYLHAQHRLFQMDISARSAGGRLSELLGERTLEIDRLERRHGILQAALKTVEGWKKNPETYSLLEDYAAGINAYISTLTDKTLPLEYKVINAQPESWSPLHSALFFKSMCRTLARGEFDAEMSNALLALGQADFDKLFPDRHPSTMPIVPTGTKWNFKPLSSNLVLPSAAKISQIIEKQEDSSPRESGIGSNNWVVAGAKTANGKPILCGDPHLNLTLPSIWYEVQLATPEFNTYGVSLPGLPFIAIGFNNDIAWTQTNSQHDVADWYKIEWKDASKKEYKLDGKYVPVEEVIEEIKVKGVGTVKEVVKYTKFGPVAFEDGSSARNDLAFHWIAAEETSNDITTFYQLAKAKNFDEFSDALKNYAYPMQNYAFACKNGDIAIRTQGWMPIRPQGAGKTVLDGTSSNNLWKGYVPFEQMPFVKNPANGFAVSANQNTTDASYPYYYHSRNFDSYRSRRINKLLAEDKKFTIEDLRAMQMDVYGLEPEELLPVALELIDRQKIGPTEQAVIEQLMTWDKYYTKDSKAAMYFVAWMDKFRKMVWDELFVVKEPSKAEIITATKTKQPLPKVKPNPYALPALWRTMQLAKQEFNNKYFDNKTTTEVENAGIMLALSLIEATKEINAEMAATLDPMLDYGKYKDAKIEHLAKFPGFSVPLYTNGNDNAINAMKSTMGPSWRMVVEMGEKPRAFVLLPGGVTGNPGSKNFTEFIERWEKGDHYEALFMQSADEKNERLKKTVEFEAK
jgi:penicillin G amidase